MQAELRLSAADILISTLNHDPVMLRSFLVAQEGHVLFTQIVRPAEPLSALARVWFLPVGSRAVEHGAGVVLSIIFLPLSIPVHQQTA